MNRTQYRPDIDGLRAVAVISVIGFHYMPQRITGGFVGVDVFFVISGYLISRIIIDNIANADFSFGQFYGRRIRRIFPALILVLASCQAFGYFALLADEYMDLGKSIAASAGFFANLLLWRETGYFDLAAELKPTLHLWSLGIEEQFYIVWPLLLVFAWRNRVNGQLLVAGIAVVSLVVYLATSQSDAAQAFYSPVSRFWELAIGGMLAYAHSHWPSPAIIHPPRIFTTLIKALTEVRDDAPQRGPWRDILSAAGMISILLPVLLLTRDDALPGWRVVAPVAGAAAILAAGPTAWLNRTVLSHPTLVWCGLISYPLYLWHWPLLSFARIVESEAPSLAIRAGALCLTIVLSWATYRLIESKLRYLRNPAVPFLLALALAIVAAAGWATYRLEGLPLRTQWLAEQQAAFTRESRELLAKFDCANDFSALEPNFCGRSNGIPTKVALLGDSHARRWFYALEPHYAASRQGLLVLVKFGCPPLLNLTSWQKGTREVCREFSDRTLAYVMGEPGITTVVLASRGPLYTIGSGFGDVPDEREHHRQLNFPGGPVQQSNIDAFAMGLVQTLDRLVKSGKQVVFVLDIPELGFDPKSCTDTRPVRLTNRVRNPCAVARADYDARNHEYRNTVMAVLRRFPGVKVWDPSRHLCDDRFCWATRDGLMLYRDDDHLSLAGARYLGARFAPE